MASVLGVQGRVMSTFWLDGEMVSRAELRRSERKKNALHAEMIQAGLDSAAAADYDAGHWYWQPIGGRAVRSSPPAADARVPCRVL